MVKKHSPKKEVVETSSKEEKSFSWFNLGVKVYPFILLAIVLFFAFHVRSGSSTLSGLEDNIRAGMYSNVKNIITQQVDQQYPNLNPAYKQEEVDKQYAQVLKSGKINFQGQDYVLEDIVQQNIQAVKGGFQTAEGQTYLMEIDPYLAMHMSINYLDHGNTGDEKINGEWIVSSRLAPTNIIHGTTNLDLLSWAEVWMFKFHGVTAKSSDNDKMAAIFYLSAIFATLAIVPLFFILWKVTNPLYAAFGCLFLGALGTFVSRTIAGFVDTDAFNILFPLLILMFVIYAFYETKRNLQIVYTVLAGVFSGIYYYAWGNAFFIVFFIILAFLGFLTFLLISSFVSKSVEKGEISRNLISLIVFTLVSYLSILFVTGQNVFSIIYSKIGGSFSSEIVSVGTSIWPNVYSSVAELNPASFAEVIQNVGGKVFFLIAMLGVLFLATDFVASTTRQKYFKIIIRILGITFFLGMLVGNWFISLTTNFELVFLSILFLPIGIAIIYSMWIKTRHSNVFLAILLSLWIAGTLYMSLNGARFILLLGPAFAVALGIGIYYLTNIINDFIVKEFSVKNSLAKLLPGVVIVSILFMIIFVPMGTQANQISNSILPLFDDDWVAAMYKIQNDSQSNAIITSWWDFGHFYATISHRSVTFDGGSQGNPAAHWVGRLLLENNEEVSHDILQMLVCGNSLAHDTFLNYTPGTDADVVKVNKVIVSTFGKSQADKVKILSNNKYYSLTKDQINTIMQYLACDKPAENYLITSEDMIGKAPVWAHWGSWDFSKKYVLNNAGVKSAEQIAKDIDENVTLVTKYLEELQFIHTKAYTENIKEKDLINQWLAPYPGYMPMQNGDYFASCKLQKDLVACETGVVVNMTSGKIVSTNLKDLTFARLIYPSQSNHLVEQTVSKTGEFDLVLVPSGTGEFKSMIVQSPLGGSLFTKLYFLNGFSTHNWANFDNRRGANQNRIIVWKTIWDYQVANTIQMNMTKAQVDNLLKQSNVSVSNSSISTTDSNAQSGPQ